MNTGEALIRACCENPTLSTFIHSLHSKPCDTTRLALSDYLGEEGIEDDWQRLLDEFPRDHLLRERFGQWLCDRGDERERGYLAMGLNKYFSRPNQYYTIERHLKVYVEITKSSSGYPCPLDSTWLNATSASKDPWCASVENEYWRVDLTRRILEDRLAVSFNSLDYQKQQALLTKRI